MGVFKELGKAGQVETGNGVACTSSGHVFAAVHDYSNSKPVSGLFRLEKLSDRSATWVPIANSFSSLSDRTAGIWRLLGTDNDELVYASERSRGTVVFWSHVRTVDRTGN